MKDQVINLRINGEVLSRFDEYSKSIGSNRSELIEKMIVDAIEDPGIIREKIKNFQIKIEILEKKAKKMEEIRQNWEKSHISRCFNCGLEKKLILCHHPEHGQRKVCVQCYSDLGFGWKLC